MRKSYCIQDGCHNCGRNSKHDEALADDPDLMCAHEPKITPVIEDGKRLTIELYAEVHPAGKCKAWKAKP